MPARSAIAIDLGRRWLRAIHATRSRQRLRVRRIVSEPLPEDLAADDPKAVGAWVGRTLSEASFPKSRATIAIAREHVALKRITLPTIDARELPEMTRLALRRELPFDPDSAVIDFVVLDQTANSTTVLAVAAPDHVVSDARQMAKAAGLGVERISLRSMGSAALVGTLPYEPGKDGVNGTLTVDISSESVEFSVVVDGGIRFSRAGELPAVDELSALTDAILTETRRTWMSYRIVEDSNDVRRAIVLGADRLSTPVAGSIGELLNVDTEVLEAHPWVEGCDQDMNSTWPLAGLLLEPGLSLQMIDFAHPRKAPDLAARRRRMVLGSVGLVAVGLLAAWTVAKTKLADLESESEVLAAQSRSAIPDRQRYKRDQLKLTHLEHWESARIDWLEHIARLYEIVPQSDQLVFDGWDGSLDFRGVRYDKDRGWSAPKRIKIVIEGESRDRATADAFRAALVESEAYAARSVGANARGGRRLPFSFSYTLRAAESVQGDKQEQEAGPRAPQPAEGTEGET